MQVGFALEFGNDIGFGHLARCVSLAQCLNEKEFPCDLISSSQNPLPSWVGDSVFRDRYSSLPDKNYDWIVTDSYSTDIELGRFGSKTRSALICDFPDQHISLACDLRIDLFGTSIRTAPDHLAGAMYIPLRDVFFEERLKTRKPNPNTVLVSLGGGQVSDHEAALCAGLHKAGFEVSCLTSQLEATVDPNNAILLQQLSALEVAKNIQQNEFIISALGGGFWESSTLAKPTLAVQTAENQNQNGQIYKEATGITPHQLGNPTFIDDVVNDCKILFREHTKLGTIATSLSCLTDGLGAGRIANHLTGPKTKSGQAVYLRPMVAEDRKLVFNWQCEPSVRQFARNPEPPSWEDHCNWFSQTLSNPQIISEIILVDNQPCGNVRLSPTNAMSNAMEVSIYLLDRVRGDGVGLAALNLLSSLVPRLKLIAYVSPDNTASKALFQRAGYLLKNGWLQRER